MISSKSPSKYSLKYIAIEITDQTRNHFTLFLSVELQKRTQGQMGVLGQILKQCYHREIDTDRMGEVRCHMLPYFQS